MEHHFRKFPRRGALSIQPKLWKQRQISRKSFQKFRNCWISEIRTFQPKILEILGASWEVEWKENCRKKCFRKFGYKSREISSYFLDQSEVKHQNQTDFLRLVQYQPHSQGSPLPYSLAPQGGVEENPGIEVGSIQNQPKHLFLRRS